MALITPMLEMAYPHVMYLPEILYEYHYDGVSNDRRQEQKEVAQEVFDRKEGYGKLGDEVLAGMRP